MHDLKQAATGFSLPCFLRTGHGSGKHDWGHTCHVTDLSRLASHVAALVDWSACVDFHGLPINTWVIREFLDILPAFATTWGMPVGRERRYFIHDGQVCCHHPYWPPDAVPTSHRHGADLIRQLNYESPDEASHLTALSRQVAAHFSGAWSLDWAFARPHPTDTPHDATLPAHTAPDEGDSRWYAIDMAPASLSWHWPHCPCPHHPQDH